MTSSDSSRSMQAMEFGEPEWDSPFEVADQPEPSQEPEPEASAPTPPKNSPQGASKMPYEPPNSQGPDRSTQWAEYEPTSFIPPQDDFAPQPMNVPQPPPGRHYAMYRQPPTWQHASTAGLGDVTSDVIASFMSNLVMIAAGAGLGYFLLGTPKGAGGGALTLMGAAQLPYVFKTGGLTRFFIGAAALGGAYWLLKDESALMQERAYRNEGDWDYEENDEDEDEPSDKNVGAKPSDDPSEPAKSSPWMKQVA